MDIVSYLMGKAAGGGGGSGEPTKIFEFYTDDGGVWIDTEASVSGYAGFCFTQIIGGATVAGVYLPLGMIQTGESYTTVWVADYKLNARVNGGTLWVSFDRLGSASVGTMIYALDNAL